MKCLFFSENKTSVVLFWADWAEQCKQVEDILKALSEQYKDMSFISVVAENFPEISMTHQVYLCAMLVQ